ncbi:porin [Aliikangiella sp. G2MR2-5]|uniref:porin n=1 Tax=Aliikangiella sp. G2MR2-5 TaxID=2788943 RepID=UPI0018AAE166|nr:porin [Aliikangiella sp. G2MR2-5]
MKIKTFALSSLALATMAATAPAFADDEWVDVYGKIMVTLDKVDNDGGDDQWEVNSNASRFGIKGKGEAGSLEAFYQLEWEVDVSDSSKSSDDHIKSRNQIVGVRGGFGEVFVGRHDTPTKKLQKKIDLFGDLSGDIKYTFNGEERADNIVQYTTPKMGGFKAKLAFVPGEQTDVNDGLADGTSLALEYKTGDLNLGVSFDSDIEGTDVDTMRAMAQYKMGDWQFGLMLQDTEVASGESFDGTMASVKYSMGDSALKLQLIDSDIWQSGVAKAKYGSQTSIGYDRKLGKKTTFFTYYTMGEVAESGLDDSIFGLGLVQKF